MLIEYKIKFEKDGLTIAQYIEPNATAPKTAANGRQQMNGLPAAQTEITPTVSANPLAKVAPDGGGAPISDTGGAPISDTGGGVPGSSMSSAPIFILGPIVFANAAPSELAKPVEPTVADSAPKALGTTAGK
jgi:hypothetical protein